MKPSQIVVIEDNPADVCLIKIAIKEKGISALLTHFENGTEAVRILCEPAEDNALIPDAILLDLNTPRTDGFDALAQLKQEPRLSQVPIAVLTSSRTRSDKQRAALLGARYVEKPSELKDFLASVGDAVEQMLASPGGGGVNGMSMVN